MPVIKVCDACDLPLQIMDVWAFKCNENNVIVSKYDYNETVNFIESFNVDMLTMFDINKPLNHFKIVPVIGIITFIDEYDYILDSWGQYDRLKSPNQLFFLFFTSHI